jgi:hypothetical protein
LVLTAISLKIDTPTGEVTPGRGFYQLEEDSLYVQIGEFGHSRAFFNYLESDGARFDIDKSGRLTLIEVPVARRLWTVDPHLVTPTIAEPADVRWLDFRTPICEPELITNERLTSLLIRFSSNGAPNWYRIAEAVFLRADRNNHLAAIMITGIEDDLAGQQIAAFRRKTNRRIDRPHKAGQNRTAG